MKAVLGISAFYHDSAASLILDGEIITATQEERFTRKKHDSSFPTKSIEFILKKNNLSISEIDKIIFHEKPFLKFERLLETYVGFAPKGFSQFSKAMPTWIKEKLFQKKLIIDSLKEIDNNFADKEKILFSEHHLSHAASAFFPSPYEEAIILTADGVGEWATTTVAIGRGNNLEIKKEIHFPNSLGLLYSSFTYYTGFKVNSGEYKLMGLAPYGDPIYENIIKKELIDIKKDGSFRLNQDYFNYSTGLTMTNNKFHKLFGEKPRDPNKASLKKFHMDIASSIQKVTEEIILKITKSLKEEYKIKNLCLAGGVALNCVANGKIKKENIFENIWIQPASGDAGCSLGAALVYWYQDQKNERIVNKNDSMKGAYLGPSYNNSTVESSLKQLGAEFSFFEDEKLFEIIADELDNQKVIGWFQGAMEFGPRALGGRSIVADPRDIEMQKKLNLKIKFRESFRPFAPAILKHRVSDFFDNTKNSPYMLVTEQIKEKEKIKIENNKLLYEGFDKLKIRRSSIPSVTHVDYSARIQTVDENNGKFYKLLNKFYNKTGCPVLINTSFNIRGEPIVCSIEDAYRCFVNTEMDILVIENFIIKKQEKKQEKKNDYVKKYLND